MCTLVMLNVQMLRHQVETHILFQRHKNQQYLLALFGGRHLCRNPHEMGSLETSLWNEVNGKLDVWFW